MTAGAQLAVALLAVAPVAAAQSRTVEGIVSRAADNGRPVPVARQWVVLHRVGSDRSGPLDSVRTDAGGRYRMRYEPLGDPDALYFVSARYSGIAYFSSPLRAAAVRAGDADIIVYATTSDTSSLRLQGRHLVLSAPRGVRREVAEVFEIENPGFQTVVPRDSSSPVWSTTLPARAESVTVAPSDVSMTAVAIRNSRAEVFAPISPGVRQLVLTYQLPAAEFPLSLPAARDISVLEVLLEEPRAVVEGARLNEVAPAAIDQRMFRRFLAQDVPASAVMRVTAPEPVGQNRTAMLVLEIVVAAAMLSALIAWFALKRGRPLTAEGRAPRADVLIAQLATLDAAFDPQTANFRRRAWHEQERAKLKDRIARALAEEERPA